jgi:hypothetical protein
MRSTFGMGMRVKIAMAAATAIAAAALIGAGLVYAQFGTLDPTTVPPRISYCGMDFHRTSQLVGSTEVGTLPTIHRIGTWLSGAPILAEAIGPAGPYNGPVCPMTVYLAADHNRYRVYFRDGGP